MAPRNTKWHLNSPDPELVRTIASQLNISAHLATLLVNRDIHSPEEALRFLNPELDTLPPPQTIAGIVQAAQIVKQAIEQNKQFTIYGDYDVDGITGTALLVNTLQSFNVEVDYYIPHRYTEGYGLNNKAIDLIAEKGAHIIITVDCGISNTREIDYAKTKGLKVVVIDHHTPPPELPAADAVVNPKLNAHPTDYYHLSGVGVAYKFVQTLYHTMGLDMSQVPPDYLELVALGTITDIVPLLNENRVLTYHGLTQLNKTRNIGLNNLKQLTTQNKKITTYTVGFVLGPRLNAAGRMTHASLGVELLLARTPEHAGQLAQQLNTINEQRKSSGRLIRENIIEQLNTHYDVSNQKCIILSDQDWNPGIIGIVASQIASEFSRPTVLIATHDGKGRGSSRSMANIDIFTPLSKCRHLFNEFGGHKEAAGFEIDTDRIPEFITLFQQIMNETLTPANLQQTIKIDQELKADEITLKLAKDILRLEPFGQSNPEPVYFSKDLFPIDFKTVGDGSHVSVTFSDGNNMIDGIGFGMAGQIDKFKHDQIEIVYHLKINRWNDRQSVQIQLIDIRNATP